MNIFCLPSMGFSLRVSICTIICFCFATVTDSVALNSAHAKSKTKTKSVKVSKATKTKKSAKKAKKKGPIVFSSRMWRLTPKKVKIKYFLGLRKSMIELNKLYEKQNRKEIAYHDVESQPNPFANMLKFFESNMAFAAEVGDPCLYAGWPSTYQQYPGWSRPYCVPSNGDGQGVGPGEDPVNSWQGNSVCPAGQILCNPALYGLGRDGSGYCTNRGNSAFQGCQVQYRDDRGYPAAEIARRLAGGLGGYSKVNQMREFINTYCAGDNISRGQRRQCQIIERRLDKLDEEWEELGLEKDGVDVADDAPTDTVGRARDHAGMFCEPRSFTQSGTTFRPVGGTSCVSCLLDIQGNANMPELPGVTGSGPGNYRTSQRYLDFLGVVSHACHKEGSGGQLGPKSPLVLMEIAKKMGSCNDNVFKYERSNLNNDSISAIQAVASGASSIDDKNREIQTSFGFTPDEFKSLFCEEGGGVKDNSAIIQGLESGEGSGLSSRRDELKSCMQSARLGIEAGNTCTMNPKLRAGAEGTWKDISRNAQDRGLPTLAMTPEGECYTMIGDQIVVNESDPVYRTRQTLHGRDDTQPAAAIETEDDRLNPSGYSPDGITGEYRRIDGRGVNLTFMSGDGGMSRDIKDLQGIVTNCSGAYFDTPIAPAEEGFDPMRNEN